jgi:hypothetical protein
MRKLRKRLPRHWARGDPEERFLFYAGQYFLVALVGFAVTAFFVSFAYLDPIYILAAFMSGLYVSVDARMRSGARLDWAPARAASLPSRQGTIAFGRDATAPSSR